MGNSAGILCYYLWPPYVIYALRSLDTIKKRIQKATNYEQLNYAKIEFEKAKRNLFLIFILCTIFHFAGGAIVNYSAEHTYSLAPCFALGIALPCMVCMYGDKRIKQREQELNRIKQREQEPRDSTNNHVLEQIAIDLEKHYSITFLPKHEIIGEFEEKGTSLNNSDSSDGNYLSANSIFVSAAGYSPVNGEYVRHGSYCGEPMWKHKNSRLELWFNNHDGKYPGVGQWRIGNGCSYIYVCNIWKHESNNGPANSGEWTLQEAKHGSKNSSGVAPYPVVSIARSVVEVDGVKLKAVEAADIHGDLNPKEKVKVALKKVSIEHELLFEKGWDADETRLHLAQQMLTKALGNLRRPGYRAKELQGLIGTENHAAPNPPGPINRVIELLLDGADPNYVDYETGTLGRAAQRGYTEIVDLLLAAGAQVDGRGDSYHRTALVLTCGSPAYLKFNPGMPRCVARLLRAGADANLRDEAGKSLWQWQAWGANTAIAAVLDRFEVSPVKRGSNVGNPGGTVQRPRQGKSNVGAICVARENNEQNPFNKNGVIYSIATNWGTEEYTNPHNSGKVKGTFIGSHGYVSGARLVQWKPDPTLQFGPGDNGEGNWTMHVDNAWVAVDLKNYSVIPSGYSLRHNHRGKLSVRALGGNGDHHTLINWKFQGSTNGHNWITLRHHKNDRKLLKDAMRKKNGEAYWDIKGDKSKAYRHFRLLQDGKNSSGNNCLMCSGIEIYGEVKGTEHGTPGVSIAQPKSNVKMNYVCIKSIHPSVREYTESYGMKVGDVIESISVDGPDGYEHEVVKLDDKTISILENERPITLTYSRISNVPIQKRSNTGIWGHAEQEIRISADGLTVTDTAKNPTSAGGGRYRPVLCEPGYSKGRHTWNVKANSAGRLEVGVSSSGFNVKGREGSALNNQSCGWCICVYEPGRNMTLWHAGRRVCYPSFKWQVGTILNVILDCDAHTLEFRLNGKAGSNTKFYNLPRNETFKLTAAFGGDNIRGASLSLVTGKPGKAVEDNNVTPVVMTNSLNNSDSSDGNYLSANSIFVSAAGYSPVNGEYVRHGSYCGEPMWKHKNSRLELWFNNHDGKYPGVGQWRIGNGCSYIYVCNIWKHESNNGPANSGEWTLQEAKHGSKNSSGVAPYPVVSIAGINDTLIEAVRKGDATLVEKLLQAGADVEYRSLDYGQCDRSKAFVSRRLQRPPLHWAIVENKPHIIPILIRYGADVNSKVSDGATALMNAKYYGVHQCIAELRKSPNLRG
eukprot:g5217.t1